MGKRIIEELATDTIQDNDFILMDNNTTPTGPDDDEAGTRKIRASEFGAQIITVDDELSDSSENPVQNKVITGAINTLASATEITGTSSGSIASFDDGASMPLKELEVSIVPTQSGSGEPSPSNVRPISGWTECNVTRCDNLFDKNSPIERGQYVSGSFQNTNVRITSDYIEITPNTNYMMSVDHLGTKDLAFINYAYFDASKNYLGNRIDNGDTAFSGERTKEVNISNSSAKYIRVTFRAYSNTDKDLSSQTLVDSGFVFAPYDSTYTTYTIQFTDGTNPLTVYGGTLDVTRGVLTVTYKGIDLGDLTWTAGSDATGQYFSAPLSPNAKKKTGSALGNNMSDIYPISPSTNVVDKSLAVNNNGNVVYVRDTSYETAIAFDTGMSGHQLVYELETPQTYSLNPTAVASILGSNNVFVDTGNVLACEYVKDTDIVIKKLLYKDLTATLSANATSLTITDSAITTDATYDIFTDTYGVNPTAVSVSNGSMTLTFTARGSATKVKVRVML